MHESGNPKIPFAFFGTPYVARDTLALLLEAGYVPSVVITSPDAPRGRGLELTPCETKVLAEARGIPVLTPETLDAPFVDALIPYGVQYAVVVAYGKMLPQEVLDTFPCGVLNIHYSLLPKYRGASPVEAALLNGDAETGVTIQRMVLKMDAGAIVAQQAVTIEPEETTKELRARLIHLGATLLVQTLPSYLAGAIAPRAQDEDEATFARKIRKEEGRISLNDDPETNWRKYRAYKESPGTFFYALKGDKRIRVKIGTASKTTDSFVIERVVPESKSEQDFAVFTGAGWIPE